MVVVRRDRMQNGLGLEESTFRRVKFEVDEWVQGMGRRDSVLMGPTVGSKRLSGA